MTFQEVREEKRVSNRPQYVYQTASTASGTGPSIASGSNAGLVVLCGTLSIAITGLHEYQIVYPEVPSFEVREEYDPEMVARLLYLDAQPPEAKFNNVIDMMNWLNSA